MLFGWLKRLGKPNRGSLERADRNAVIRRIVAAAADEGRSRSSTASGKDAKAGPGVSAPAGSSTAEPPRFTEDGRPITPLPMGKPPSGSVPAPGDRVLPAASQNPESRVNPLSSVVSPPVEEEIPREKIAQRAMEIWMRKGRPAGTSEQDWIQAEAELRAEMLYLPSDSSAELQRKSR